MKIAQSEALFARAQNSIPGGVNSPVRAFRSVGGTPVFVERGEVSVQAGGTTVIVRAGEGTAIPKVGARPARVARWKAKRIDALFGSLR